MSIRNLRPSGLTKTWHEKVTKLKKQFAAGHNTSSVQAGLVCASVCVLFCLADNTTRVQYEQLNTVTKVAKQTKVETGRVVVVPSSV